MKFAYKHFHEQIMSSGVLFIKLSVDFILKVYVRTKASFYS